MPIRVATIDLSAAVVGNTFPINIGQATPPPTLAQQMKPNIAGHNTVLKIHNESGVGFGCAWPVNNQSFSLPAGQWPTIYPPPNEQVLSITVVYVLPNAPVNILFADLYLPGEQVYETGALGNSPVNGGSVVTQPIPRQVFQALNQVVTATSTQLYIFTPTLTGLYRANLHFTYRNPVPQKVKATVGFFDPILAGNTHATFMLESPDSNLGQFLTGTQATTTGNNQTAACAPIVFEASPGGFIVLNFQDGGGTPNDVVNFVLELIGT